MGVTPYSELPENAFWRKAVAAKGALNYENLWQSKWVLPSDAAFSTYGSCFAQHISRALISREMNWVNTEPAPGKVSDDLARKYNYGIYSARTANIYSTAQLRRWCELAMQPERIVDVEIWENDGRYRDCLRPAIEPDGFGSESEARASLLSTVRSFRRSIESADVFIFTLGLTEGWENSETGSIYSVCPGTLGGTFDTRVHKFRNYDYPSSMADLQKALEIMSDIRAELKVLLTVSPVPLVASASGNHVLSATTYSKSVLRAVAGSLAEHDERVDYFPSYEIISAPPTRAMFFEPDMRSVARQGVELVMGHFFNGLRFSAAPGQAVNTAEKQRREDLDLELAKQELICEELALDMAKS